MDRFIDAIVRRSIRHARLMLRQGAYDWPTARTALRKILADMESAIAEPSEPAAPSRFYRLERSRMACAKIRKFDRMLLKDVVDARRFRLVQIA